MGRLPSQLRVLLHRVVYALLLLLRLLFRPLRPEVAVRIGAAFGSSYARLRGPRTRDAATNLKIAFPDSSDDERRRLLVSSFANLGRCIAEVFVLQGPHSEALLDGLDVEGLEHYEAAKASSASGGIIILTAHFGSWELCGAAMTRAGHPLSVVHHPVANPYLDAMVSGWRQASGVEELVLGRAAIGVFRALARGRLVTLLVDQNAHRDEGVFAPFFGVEASTRSGPASIAMMRGVPVLPVFIFRHGTTARHTVRVFPPLAIESVSDEARDADRDEAEQALVRNVARMNDAIEQAIRIAPDHWLWSHRRFKTRPEGERPIYPRRQRRNRRSSKSRASRASERVQ